MTEPARRVHGSVSGYQALSYGYLVGEVRRRITGQTVGAFFAEQVAGQFGVDFRNGLPDTEFARRSEMIEPPPNSGYPVAK